MVKINKIHYQNEMLSETFSASSLDNNDYNVNVFHNSYYYDYNMIAWMTDSNGDIVAMVRFFTPTENYMNLSVLCDVETHPDFRGKGLARTLIESLNEKYGTLHTSGNFSVTGADAFMKHIPLLPGNNYHVNEKTNSYSFVDWKNGRTFH